MTFFWDGFLFEKCFQFQRQTPQTYKKKKKKKGKTTLDTEFSRFNRMYRRQEATARFSGSDCPKSHKSSTE